MTQLMALRQRWNLPRIPPPVPASSADLLAFEARHRVTLPADLVAYFQLANGTSGLYEDDFFCFYELAQVQSIAQKFSDYHGSPKYSDLLRTLPDYASYYVVADYMHHLFAYAIRLAPDRTVSTPVYVLCGGEYRLLAPCFTDFLTLYLDDSDHLLF